MASTARQPSRPAILLAHFGTTVPSALDALQNVKRVVAAAFPDVEVRIAFTSNIIRNIWRRRRAERDSWLARGVPPEVIDAMSVLGAIGKLQDEGFRELTVQPTHIFHGEQYEDLKSYIQGLQSIRTIKPRWMPFESIKLGRPILGTHGPRHDYRLDVAEAVAALEPDAALARERGASLVYAGHGNEYFSTGVFAQFERAMNEAYPDVATHVGMVEGRPDRDDVMRALSRDRPERVLLKPLMVTAGDHAHNDLSGDHSESWRAQLQLAGYRVDSIMEGLGSNDAFAALYQKRIEQAIHKT
ncbi:MAG: sirohydrochlorin cobaltochelatase [Myxococcales bacterium]|nr:sirohydrochlorin cobaltochelatase [Myxococcales bacterium]